MANINDIRQAVLGKDVPEGIASGLPIYLHNVVKEKTKFVQNLITENSIVIPFVTDMHHDNTKINSIAVINHICKTTPVDLIVDGGDGQCDCSGDAKQYRLDGFTNMVKQIDEKEKYCPCCGNHDFQFYDPEGIYHSKEDGNNYYIGVTQVEEYTRLMKHLDNIAVFDVNNKKGMYYYKDIESKKVRVIILNTNEGNYGVVSNLQLQWLSNIALNFSDKSTPHEWQVMFFTHCNLCEELQAEQSFVQNRDVILNIIKAFKNGTSYTNENLGINCTFTTRGIVIGIFCGHIHLDRMVVKDGIQHIATLSDACVKYLDAPDRVAGTESEIAIDIITIDVKTRIVNLTRIGAGSDRSFTY